MCDIGFAVISTSFGRLRVDYRGDIVYGIGWVLGDDGVDDGVGVYGVRSALVELVECELESYFVGDGCEFSFEYCMVGTDFQRRVWRALLDISYGETMSYGDLARVVGCSGGARAVGIASNRNPFQVVVPCHRVVGADGSLVGYVGGLELKGRLLDLESGFGGVY